MKTRWMVMSLSAALMLAVGLQAAKEESSSKEKEFKATCPVSGKPAGEDHMVKLKNGEKVYFCCDNCPKAFAKSPKKFDAQVNRQLLETGQVKQVACPLTGKPLNKSTLTDVGTTKVAFCCDKCEAKYNAASDEEKLKMVFSNAAMKKGFKRTSESSKDEKKHEKKDAA
jgi:YHS domain-containing protein